jgi:hypothetical protein
MNLLANSGFKKAIACNEISATSKIGWKYIHLHPVVESVSTTGDM